MTAISQPTSPALPEQLLAPLREIVRRRRMIALGRGLLQTFAYALGVLMLAALFIGFVPLPVWLRVPIAGGFWLAILYLAGRSIWPALKRWTLDRAALQVEGSFPDLDERLSSAVELTTLESNPAFRGSPELVAHLVRQAESDAAAIRPTAVVTLAPLIGCALALIPLCIAWIVLAFNGHTARPILRGLYGTFVPWAAHAPAVLETVAVKPGDIVLAQGDSLNVVANVLAKFGDGSNGSPATLIRQFQGGQSQSQPLASNSAGEFSTTIEDVRQDFTYRVKTDWGTSEWYAVTVRPRPAVARLDVHFDYPPYTGLSPRDDLGHEGLLETLVGTKLTLTVRTDAPISDKSHLVLNEGKRDEEIVPLTQSGANEYQAKLTVNRSGEFFIRLLNEFGLTNKDAQPSTITARFDQVPSVSIIEPGGQVSVRPDDTVPVEFLAADDFAIGTLQAVVQIDESPEQTIALHVPESSRRGFKGTWPIDIPKLLSRAGVTSASRISYQLKVVDNRDPDPQAGQSGRQVLVLDRNQGRSYAAQQNEQRKRRLEDAIRKAIERLRQADWRGTNLKNLDERHVLSTDERRDVGDLRELLVTTSGDLSAAADEFLSTPFGEVAARAKEIAEHTVADAADDVARAQFSAENPMERRRNAEQGQLKVADALKRLEKLIASAEQAQKKAEALAALRDAARRQQEAADAMAQQPQNADRNRQAQQEAINKLNEAINKDPSLNNPQAKETAKKLAEMTDQIEDDQKQQTKLQTAAGQQQRAADASQSARELMDAQKDLNNQIELFRQENGDLLKKAGTAAPTADQQKEIVNRIDRGELPGAGAAMKNAANRLKDNEHGLQEAAAKTTDPNPDKQATDRQAIEDAAAEAERLSGEQEALQRSIETAARQMADSRKGALPNDQLARQQRELAQKTSALQKAADQMAEQGKMDENATLEKRMKEAQDLLSRAADAQSAAADAAAQEKPDEAAGAQADAQDALAQAEDALRGNTPAPKPGEGNKDAGKGQDATAKQGEDESAKANGKGEQQSGKGQEKPDAQQASRDAARSAQEAAAAQRQAMRPNPAAARQAANALARAAASAAQASQGKPDSSKPTGEDPSAGQDAADATSQSDESKESDKAQGRSVNAKSGIRGQTTGGNNTTPASVSDLGISAGDWAKLPPLVQQDLLNAAQQSGPPTYREMIRNYYVRIAKMQSDGSPAPRER